LPAAHEVDDFQHVAIRQRHVGQCRTRRDLAVRSTATLAGSSPIARTRSAIEPGAARRGSPLTVIESEAGKGWHPCPPL
jgi:hypothetical protein